MQINRKLTVSKPANISSVVLAYTASKGRFSFPSKCSKNEALLSSSEPLCNLSYFSVISANFLSMCSPAIKNKYCLYRTEISLKPNQLLHARLKIKKVLKPTILPLQISLFRRFVLYIYFYGYTYVVIYDLPTLYIVSHAST